jgi:D-arabinose 1-dehydrogenase-like Zn-dependent alcohol dehydrogenase
MAENKKVDQCGVCEMSKNQTENHCHTVNLDTGSDEDSDVLGSFDSRVRVRKQ